MHSRFLTDALAESKTAERESFKKVGWWVGGWVAWWLLLFLAKEAALIFSPVVADARQQITFQTLLQLHTLALNCAPERVPPGRALHLSFFFSRGEHRTEMRTKCHTLRASKNNKLLR